MSTRTSSGRSAVAYWISFVAGLAVLAVLTVFVVVLPELDDADEVSLPERLAGGFLAVDVARTVDPNAPAVGDTPPQTQDDADRNAQELSRERDYSDQVLADVIDGDVTTRTYFNDESQQVLWVQVFGEELGSFVPAFVRSPEVRGLAKPPVELERIDDTTTCVTEWAEVPEGQEFEEAQARGGVTCQRSEGGRTLRVTALGQDQDQTMEMLEVVEGAIS
ncbi:hypothetical protein [Nocardioides pacificus]